MQGKEVKNQLSNEQIKKNLVQFLKSNLVQIYDVCSPKCLTNFSDTDLTDREKICLSKCFERKNETFNITMEYLNKYIGKGDDQSGKVVKVIDGTEIIYE